MVLLYMRRIDSLIAIINFVTMIYWMGTSVETTSSAVPVRQVGMVLIASINISLLQFKNSMSRTTMNELAHTVAYYGCAASRTRIF